MKVVSNGDEEELQLRLDASKRTVLASRARILELKRQRVALQERQQCGYPELLAWTKEEWAIERGYELSDLASRCLDLEGLRSKLAAVESAQSQCLGQLDEIEMEKERRRKCSEERMERIVGRRHYHHHHYHGEQKDEVIDRVVRESQNDLEVVRQLAVEMEVAQRAEAEATQRIRQSAMADLNAKRNQIEEKLDELRRLRREGDSGVAADRAELGGILEKIEWRRYPPDVQRSRDALRVSLAAREDKVRRRPNSGDNDGDSEGEDGRPALLGGLEDQLNDGMDDDTFAIKVENAMRDSEDVMDELDDELGDLELEGRWVDNWTRKNGEWAGLEDRQRAADKQDSELKEEDLGLVEAARQLEYNLAAYNAQQERKALREATAAASAEIQMEVLHGMVRDVAGQFYKTAAAAAEVVDNGILAGLLRASSGTLYNREASQVQGLDALLRGTLDELRKQRAEADKRLGVYHRPTLALHSSAPGKDHAGEVRAPWVSVDEGPVELRVEDAMTRSVLCRGMRVRALLRDDADVLPTNPRALCGDIIDAACKLESEYWQRVMRMPTTPTLTISLSKDTRGATAATMTQSRTARLSFLAVGTSGGGVSVWQIPHARPFKQQNPLLLRVRGLSTVPRTEQRAITQLCFSSDGVSQLLGLDEAGVAWLWGTAATHDNAIDEPAKATESFKARLLAPRGRVDANSMLRPVWAATTQAAEAQQGDKKQKRLMKSDRPTSPSSPAAAPTTSLTLSYVAFHPAITILGHQTSFIVGAKSGVIAKFNTDKSAVGRVGAVVYGASPATFEYDTPPPSNSVAPYRPVSSIGRVAAPHEASAPLGPSKVYREIFEFHSAAVVYMGYCGNLSLDLFTLDAAGYAALWPYSERHITGCKWFIPSRSARVDLDIREFTPLPASAQGRARRVYSQVDVPEGKFNTAAAASALEVLKSLSLQLWRSRVTEKGWRDDTYVSRRGQTTEEPQKRNIDVHVVKFDEKGRFRAHHVSVCEQVLQHGTLVAAQPTCTRHELVLLVTYTRSVQAVPRLFVLRMDTFELLPICISCPPPADAPPTTVPQLTVGPPLETTQTDYAYVSWGAAGVSIYSLNTRQRVQPGAGDGTAALSRGVPQWRCAICPSYKWLVSFSSEANDLRLYSLTDPRTNSTTPAALAADFQLWRLGRELNALTGRKPQPPSMTRLHPYEAYGKVPLDLNRDMRMCRALVYELVEDAVDEAKTRTDARKSRSLAAQGSKQAAGAAEAVRVLGNPPYGRVPPVRMDGDEDAQYRSAPEWWRRHHARPVVSASRDTSPFSATRADVFTHDEALPASVAPPSPPYSARAAGGDARPQVDVRAEEAYQNVGRPGKSSVKKSRLKLLRWFNP